MSRIAEFIDANGIKQKELAAFLGIGEPSISKMANGFSNPSKENLHKLLNNDRGWDTSMLTEQERPSIIQQGTGNVAGDGNHFYNMAAQSMIETQMKIIDSLQERVKYLEEQNREYWEMIKKYNIK